MPNSALFAVMLYSCLDLTFNGKSRRLHLDVGDVLLLSGCVAHRGLLHCISFGLHCIIAVQKSSLHENY